MVSEARAVDPNHALFLRYCAGERLQLLADEAGLTRRGLRDRWESRGWQLPVRRKELLVSEAKAILTMARAGKTVPEIVTATGRQRETIEAFLRRKGMHAARAPRPMVKAEHWRRVLGRLLNGDTWRAILGPNAVANDRKRELHGLQRYCARVHIPLPAAALTTIGRT